MSIGSVGAFGSVDPGEILAKMLARLDSTNDTNSTTSSNFNTNTGSVPAASEGAASNALTGTGQSTLSDQVLALLVHLQQQSAGGGTQAGANTSTVPQTLSATDPVQQLFSAMDTDGDGSVSKSEMESFIQGKGGTQAQADALFSALTQNTGGQNAATGISEQQMAADVSQAQHSGHHHHHGGHGMDSGGANTASDAMAQIFNALDTNHDGSISADEFSTAFRTTNTTGGTGASATDPAALFAQIDSNSNGMVSSSELGSFLTALAQQTQSNVNTMGMFGQLAAQSYSSTAGLLNQNGLGQSSYA